MTQERRKSTAGLKSDFENFSEKKFSFQYIINSAIFKQSLATSLKIKSFRSNVTIHRTSAKHRTRCDIEIYRHRGPPVRKKTEISMYNKAINYTLDSRLLTTPRAPRRPSLVSPLPQISHIRMIMNWFYFKC